MQLDHDIVARAVRTLASTGVTGQRVGEPVRGDGDFDALVGRDLAGRFEPATVAGFTRCAGWVGRRRSHVRSRVDDGNPYAPDREGRLERAPTARWRCCGGRWKRVAFERASRG